MAIFREVTENERIIYIGTCAIYIHFSDYDVSESQSMLSIWSK